MKNNLSILVKVCGLWIVLAFISLSTVSAQTSQSRSLPSIIDEIQILWDSTLDAAQVANDAQVAENVSTLVILRNKAGLLALEDYALELIAEGESRYKKNDLEAASFYLGKAQMLSPQSARVVFRSLQLVQVTEGMAAVFRELFRGVVLASGNSEYLLSVGKALVYPVLWALTFSMYACFVFVFLWHLPAVLRIVAHRLPGVWRGLLTPLCTLAFLLLPCFLGPIACLCTWAILTLFFLPQFKRFASVAGVVVCLWGICIPLRENVGAWLAQPGVQTMLRVTSGTFGKADEMILRQLLEDRPQDGVVWYTYAQVLKRSGEFREALNAFTKAEEFLGAQGWTIAERANIAFLSGNSKEANTLFEESIALGLNTAGLYFNFSKVKFDIVEPKKSREYLAIAREKDAPLVDRLQVMENSEGLRSQLSLADIHLPTRIILSSALLPMAEMEARANQVTGALLKGFSPIGLSALGGVVWLLTLFVGATRSSRYSSYYTSYQPSFIIRSIMTLVPGMACIRAEQTFLGLGISAVSIFLFLPVIAWPPEMKPLQDLVPGFIALYGMLVFLLILLGGYVAYQSKEKV